MSQTSISNSGASRSINMDANTITGSPIVSPLDRKVGQQDPVRTDNSIKGVCQVFADKRIVTAAHPANPKVSEFAKARRPNNQPRPPRSLGSDSPRCMRYNCSQKSKDDYNKCFCSEECQDIVFENSHSAAIVLVGLGPSRDSSSLDSRGDRVPYSIILKGRRKDLKSNEEWEAPGGVRERGLSETAIGCAIRECVEETGMVIKVDKMAKYLLYCPMIAMSIKSGTRFSGIYHLTILAHISDFNDLEMHKAWVSRMDRYTRKELDKSGRPVVRSDCVDMEYSAALDLQALWIATTKSRSSRGALNHPRKSAKLLLTSNLETPEQQGPSPAERENVILCYRDYWSMSVIHDRGLIGAVIAMPTLEQSGIWDRTFVS